MLQQVFLDRVSAEPGDGAQSAGDRGAGPASLFQVTGDGLDVSAAYGEQRPESWASPEIPARTRYQRPTPGALERVSQSVAENQTPTARLRLPADSVLMVRGPGVTWLALMSTGSVIDVDDLPGAVAGAGTGAAGRLRPLAVHCRLRGSGHLLGCPGDSYQAGQAWPL
jgi:hypothetical protein